MLVVVARVHGSMAPWASVRSLFGMTSAGSDLHPHAEAGAGWTGAVGAVEAERAWGYLADADAAIGAGEVLGVDALLRLALDADVDDTAAELQRRLDGIGDPGAAAARGLVVFAGIGHHDPVDDDLDVVPLRLRERQLFGEVAHDAIDADADEAGAAGVIEHLLMLALATAYDGGQHHQPRTGRRREDGVDDLLHRLPLDRLAALRAVRPAGAREEQPEVVVDLGDGADGRARIARRALLVDRDGGREPFDVIDVGLLHLAQELAGVGGE